MYAKDLVLALIAAIGAGGATGYAVEFTGQTVELLDIEARLTLCNMATEAGARTGLIAPTPRCCPTSRAAPSAPPAIAGS